MSYEIMHSSQIAKRLERLPVSWLHYKLLVIHGFGWLFDALDVGIVTFVMAALAEDWKLQPNQLGLVGSASLAGMFLGAAISGIVADYWGRKKVFQVTLLVFAVTTLLCAFAWNVTSMVIFRFLVGVGLGGELPVVSSLLSEFVPGRHRGRFIVLLESFWAYGWLIAALVAFLVIPAHGWRIAFIIGAIPAFYIWVVRRKLPESPRWYESKGRLEEAEAVMSSLELESERLTGQPLPPAEEGTDSEPAKLHRFTFAELWTPAYRQRTIMLWVLWFGLVFGYYGIFVWLPTLLVKAGYSMVNSFLYVIIITLAQIPGYFSAAYLVEGIGRKPVIVVYLLMSAVTAYLFGQASSTAMILVWASLMSFFNLGAWGAVYTYTPELYPTRDRATGAGAAAAFGRVGGLIAPFLVGELLPTIGRGGVLTMNAALLVVAAGAVWVLGVETKGKQLEDIAA
ncbi:MAG TPA: MFS transporter [Verrucomicrobiae bacterium]|nr:MFS transporter [Verrucomicrobiae bacterium]